MQHDTEQNEGPGKEKRFVDEQTDKRNYEHLTNENDEISEEDISNVKTDVTDPNEHVSTSRVEEDIPAEKEDNDEDNDEPGSNKEGIQTPWNILGE
jgi:hypothetical protein